MPRSATLLLIALLAGPPQAMAQEANPEPGYCAQYYPDRDCNTIEPPQPKQPAAPPHKTAAAKKKHAAK